MSPGSSVCVQPFGRCVVSLPVQGPLVMWDASPRGLVLLQVGFDPDDLLNLLNVLLDEGP